MSAEATLGDGVLVLDDTGLPKHWKTVAGLSPPGSGGDAGLQLPGLAGVVRAVKADTP